MRAIIVATLKEAMRKRTFIVMGIVSILYLMLWSILLYHFQSATSGHGMGEEQFKAIAAVMLTQAGLQFSSMLICLLAIMLGSGAIASELETGMVHSILSKPIRRYEYVIGKFLGILSLMVAYAAILYTFIMLIGNMYSLTTIISLSVAQFISGLLFYLAVPATILSITIFGSVILKVVPNGLLMIFIYILGNIGGMVEMIGKFINNRGIISSGILLSLISPFHTLFSTAERILLPSSGIAGEMMRTAGGLSGSGQPASIWMYIYIVIYAVGFLMFAVSKFNKKDIN